MITNTNGRSGPLPLKEWMSARGIDAIGADTVQRHRAYQDEWNASPEGRAALGREREQREAVSRPAPALAPAFVAATVVAEPPAGESFHEYGARVAATEAAPAPRPRYRGREHAPTALVSHVVDPGPWLNGTYVAPEPSVGVHRDDTVRLLYPERWHTVIALNAAGKTWFALAHVRDELNDGHVVAYAHFEESTMAGTLERLLKIGVTRERIRSQFLWLDCGPRWQAGEMAADLMRLGRAPGLLVLDGINAACHKHDQDPTQVSAVGWYRETFVAPATRLGAAVLSLGHPPKAKDRQGERHGFGSTAWLDEVDGVGFRMEAHRQHPIKRGARGSALVYSAKDRYGSVERHGSAAKHEGWTFLGSLAVDDASDPEGKRTTMHLSAPRPEDAAESKGDPIEVLAERIVEALAERPDRAYGSQTELQDCLYERGVKFTKTHIDPALGLLAGAGRLTRDPASTGRNRGGQLAGGERRFDESD